MPVERTAYTNAPSNRRSLAITACQRSVGLMAENLVRVPTRVLSGFCAQILTATAHPWTGRRSMEPCLLPCAGTRRTARDGGSCRSAHPEEVLSAHVAHLLG